MITAVAFTPVTMTPNSIIDMKYVLKGNTWEHRDIIKAQGGWWDDWSKRWYVHDDEMLNKIIMAVNERLYGK